jgi:hypothetical protein
LAQLYTTASLLRRHQRSADFARALRSAILRVLRQTHEGVVMAKYGKKAQSKVEKAMHERKRGTLKSGKSGKTVKSRKQAIAIGLSEARRAGAKVPKRKS